MLASALIAGIALATSAHGPIVEPKLPTATVPPVQIGTAVRITRNTPRCPRNVTIRENAQVACKMRRFGHLHIVLNWRPTVNQEQTVCDNMGGTLRISTDGLTVTCRNVDY